MKTLLDSIRSLPRSAGAILALIVTLAFTGIVSAQPREVMSATALAQRAKAPAGDKFALAVVLTFDNGWHAWPNKPVIPDGLDVDATPTTMALAEGASLPKGVRVFLENAQWPEPHEVESAGFTGEPVKILSLSGRTVIYIPVTVGSDAAPGPVSIPLSVHYQACDDTTCMPPTDAVATATFEVVPAGTPPQDSSNTADFAAFKTSVLESLGGTPPTTSTPSPAAVPKPDAANAGEEGAVTEIPPDTTLFGYKLPDPTSPVGMLVLLVVSILGGAIMNLTPCVLPVIPIKVMTLTQHAGHDGGALKLGLWMSLGIVAFWTAIGIPMAFVSASFDPSIFIFGTWWVTVGIGLVIVAMGLGIMGMFNITLPQSVYAVNPKADTPWGSFVFGIMTAVLGLPCFGFVAGGLLAAASTMPPVAILAVFFGMGVGMAAPFLVLSARPQLVSKMPRTGPASELVKQVMGLMLLAAAAFFIASGIATVVSEHPYLSETMHWWAVAFFMVIAGLWLIYRTFQITGKPGRRVVFTVVALAMGGLSLAMALSETSSKRENWEKLNAGAHAESEFVTGAWNHYTPALFEKARGSGKIVVADFTAKWCLICKSLRKSVLNPDPVNAEITKDDVVLIEVDCATNKLPGSKFLNSLGRTGIPTLAIFTPGVDQPEIFNAYTKQNVLDALQRARARSANAR